MDWTKTKDKESAEPGYSDNMLHLLKKRKKMDLKRWHIKEKAYCGYYFSFTLTEMAWTYHRRSI